MELRTPALTGLLTTPDTSPDIEVTMERLTAISLNVIDLHQLSLSKLIDFREREEKSSDGSALRGLRHGYLDKLAAHARRLATIKASEHREVDRQFEEDIRDDLTSLKRELRWTAVETLGSPEFVVAALGVTSLVASGLQPSVSNPWSLPGAPVSIGGLLALKSKFARTRHEVLRRHPMAYLYEMTGPLKL